MRNGQREMARLAVKKAGSRSQELLLESRISNPFFKAWSSVILVVLICGLIIFVEREVFFRFTHTSRASKCSIPPFSRIVSSAISAPGTSSE